jgi:hypothetical protein
MGWACIIRGQMRNAHDILGDKTERKRSLERPKHNLEDNIKTYMWTGLS